MTTVTSFTLIVIALIFGVTLNNCVKIIMDVWDDEQRRKHHRWEAEREDKDL